jgi:hypothetical protein
MPLLHVGRRTAPLLYCCADRRGDPQSDQPRDALLDGTRLNFTKLILTFAVPYCVATYGAVSFRLSLPRSGELWEEARSLDQQEASFLRTTKGGK